MTIENTMTRKEASAKISTLISEAEAKIAEAIKISEIAGIAFKWDACGYGMGGVYVPQKETNLDGEWEESSSSNVGWISSSEQC